MKKLGNNHWLYDTIFDQICWLTKLTSSLQGEQPIWDNVGTMWRLQISCNTKEDWECSRADGWGRDTLEMTVQLQAKFYYIFAKSCWKVEVEVTWDCTRRNTWVTNAIPSYMIREDTGWDTSLVLSFLMACKVECVCVKWTCGCWGLTFWNVHRIPWGRGSSSNIPEPKA